MSAAGGAKQRRMKSGGQDKVRKRRKEKSNIFSKDIRGVKGYTVE